MLAPLNAFQLSFNWGLPRAMLLAFYCTGAWPHLLKENLIGNGMIEEVNWSANTYYLRFIPLNVLTFI